VEKSQVLISQTSCSETIESNRIEAKHSQ